MLQESGPLGTFGSRIKLAYLLGLIGDGLRRELDTIRDVRNEFAHVRTRVSFKTQRIADLTNNLATAQILSGFYESMSTQEKFVASAYLAAEVLIGQSLETKPSDAAEFYFPYIRRLAKTAALEELRHLFSLAVGKKGV